MGDSKGKSDSVENNQVEKKEKSSLEEIIDSLKQSDNKEVLANLLFAYNSIHPICFGDINTRKIISVNDSFVKFFKADKEDFVNKDFFDKSLWRYVSDYEEFEKQLNNNGFVQTKYARFVDKEGKVVHGHISGTFAKELFSEKYFSLQGIIQDVEPKIKEVFKSKLNQLKENKLNNFYSELSTLDLKVIWEKTAELLPSMFHAEKYTILFHDYDMNQLKVVKSNRYEEDNSMIYDRNSRNPFAVAMKTHLPIVVFNGTDKQGLSFSDKKINTSLHDDCFFKFDNLENLIIIPTYVDSPGRDTSLIVLENIDVSKVYSELNNKGYRFEDSFSASSKFVREDFSRDFDWDCFESLEDQALKISRDLGMIIYSGLVHESKKKEAEFDGLTGLYNRRTLDQFGELFFENSRRIFYNDKKSISNKKIKEDNRKESYASDFSLLFLDIDDFKYVNDTYGHIIGDMVLKTISASIRGISRAQDIVGRYGGEEILLLLPQTNNEGALSLAERIRKDIEKRKYEIDNDEFSVTVSIGVSSFPKEDAVSYNDLFKQADVALYYCKNNGKNRVADYNESLAFKSV